MVLTGVAVKSSSNYGFSSSSSWFGDQDVQLWRDAASVLAQRTGTSAQTFRLYRTYTDLSNYERLALQAGSGYVELAAETAGTGNDNIDVWLTPAGMGRISIIPGSGSGYGAKWYAECDQYI